jgi:diguanylate cyclase (GGDEF)-like protein
MEKPAIPPDEAERLKALRRLNILDTPAEERFDRITRLARRVLGVPMALVSLVDEDRQWFKSAQGVDAEETAREISFCGHGINAEGEFVVPDSHADPRFADNPMVTGEPGIRFYGGVPLRAEEGLKVGMFCVMDRKPRHLSTDDIQTLHDLAALVEDELRAERLGEARRELAASLREAERRASVDHMTRLWNRSAIMDLLRRELAVALRQRGSVGVIMGDLDHFKAVNDTHGHAAGDAVLKEASRRLRASIRGYDSAGRWGGEEFLVVLPGADISGAMRAAATINRRFRDDPFGLPNGKTAPVTISLGVAAAAGREPEDAERLVQAADEALYRAKKEGRDRAEAA